MPDESISKTDLENSKEIARLWESTKSAHKRIDETDRIADGLHELALSVASMTAEVKRLSENSDKNTDRFEKGLQAQSDRIERGLKEHGERLGALEKTSLAVSQNEGGIKKLTERVDALEKEPGQKWKSLTAQIIGIVVTAIVTGIIVKLT